MSRTVPAWCALPVALLAACSSGTGGATPPSSSAGPSSAADTRPVSVLGSVVVDGQSAYRGDDPKGSPCWTTGNAPSFPSPSDVDDIKEGAQVTVADAAGKTVAVGTLMSGVTARRSAAEDHPDCVFAFRVADIPSGSGFYEFTVGTHSATVQESSFPVPVLRFG